MRVELEVEHEGNAESEGYFSNEGVQVQDTSGVNLHDVDHQTDELKHKQQTDHGF